MTFDDGILTVYSLANTAVPGRMPVEQLVEQSRHRYAELRAGVTRVYAAKGVKEQIDLFVRIWQDREVRTGMYITDRNGDQYRIDDVRHTYDEDGLRVSDITLSRLEKDYDVATE